MIDAISRSTDLQVLTVIIVVVFVFWGAAKLNRIQGGGTRTCPWCAEPIQSEARICRFCQREVSK